LDTSDYHDRKIGSNLNPKIRNHWRRLTDEDIAELKLHGNMGELVRILRKRYGYGKEQAEIEIANWMIDQGIQPHE
jgi:hypothetical protein